MEDLNNLPEPIRLQVEALVQSLKAQGGVVSPAPSVADAAPAPVLEPETPAATQLHRAVTNQAPTVP